MTFFGLVKNKDIYQYEIYDTGKHIKTEIRSRGDRPCPKINTARLEHYEKPRNTHRTSSVHILDMMSVLLLDNFYGREITNLFLVSIIYNTYGVPNLQKGK